MSRKTISAIYADAHHALGVKQNQKYGNPITEPPSHVPGVLERAVKAGLMTEPQARKLALVLGRLSYGEYGLTHGRVAAALDKVLGFHAPGSMQLAASLSA